MKTHTAGSIGISAGRFLAGLTIAMVTLQVVLTWLIVCGPSSASLVCLSVAGCVGIFISVHWVGSRAVLQNLPWISVTALLATGSWALPTTLDRLLTLSVQLSGSSGSSLAFVGPAFSVCLQTALLSVWVCRMTLQRHTTESGRCSLITVGAACGVVLSLIHATFVLPLACSVTAVLTLTLLCELVVTAGGSVLSPPTKSLISGTSTQGLITTSLAAGIALHAGIRFTTFLMPLSSGMVLPAVSITLLAVLFAQLPGIQRWLAGYGLLFCVLLLGTYPLLFDFLVDINLAITATTSSVILLTLLRSVQLAVLWIPAAICCTGTSGSGDTSYRTTIAFCCLGLATATLLALAGVTPQLQLLGAIILFLLPRLTTSGNSKPSASSVPVGLKAAARNRPLAAWGVGAAAICLITIANPDLPAASQLLYSGRSAVAYRVGLDRDMIEESDCARLLEQHSSDGGLLTVWRTSGDQMLLRRDGYVSEGLSANLLTTPQPIAETLTTLLPLVMHKHAQTVMLLGDDSGVGLRVCCHFPIHTIHAVRADSATTDVARRLTWNSAEPSCDEDDRVTIQHSDPAIAVRAARPGNQRFDVVVAASPNPASVAGQSMLSTEFYQAVRSQLSDEGVFSQRIAQHDLGAEPLIRIASALREVFGRVAMLQMAPGEVLVVAGVQPDSLLDEGLLERLRRDHAMRELGASGWDWSQVAALPIIDTHDPLGIFEHRETLSVSTAGNAYFSFALPLEAIRWGDKAGELQQAFGPHQRHLADAVPRTPDYQEYARRYSAVVQQKEILTSFPDNPWPYRRSLKVEMQRNPRPPQESVVDGKVVQVIDPHDSYRKDYFLTLGRLLRQAADGTVDPLTIREFDRFATRYEPLLSYFAAFELIRVQELTGHPSPALELRNRLHTIYYSEPGDFSIRQLNAALSQVLDDPELLVNVEDRYDHVNSMLQELVHRWEARQGYNPPSARRTQQDVDECVRVANLALEAMAAWGLEMQIPNDQLAARRRFVTQSLISPLRNYREQVLAHRIKAAGPSLEEEFVGPDDLPLMADPQEALTN